MSFPKFPYTDFHRLNADWIIEKIKEMLGLTREAQQAAEDAAADAAESAEAISDFGSRLFTVETAVQGAVRFDEEQELTDIERAQGRANIGAASTAQVITLGNETAALRTRATSIETNAVRVDTAQSFTDAQKIQGRNNISAASTASVETAMNAIMDLNNVAVRVNSAQSFTAAQQLQARNNIGAASVDAAQNGAVVYTTAQNLSDTEKRRARDNIDALSYINPSINGYVVITDDSAAGNEGDEVTVVIDSTLNHSNVKFTGSQSTLVRISGIADPYENDEAVNKGFADDNYETQWKTTPVSGSTPSITPADHTIFECGECSTLTVSTPLADEFVLTFDSGSTATILYLPAAVNMPADFQVNANMHYEINIRKTYGVYAAWEIEVTP